ncbi:MAG: DUF1800 family protein [Bacteroidia bacterium]
MQSTKRNIQHLFLRAGFGDLPQAIEKYSGKSVVEIVEAIFSVLQNYSGLDFIKNPIAGREDKEVSSFRILRMILKSRRETEDLNIVWMNKMAQDESQLREKMTFFWHNHFSTSTPFAYLMQIQNNTIRKFALGKFSDLLHAIAKDPAMIIYLNNQQNHKKAPNENFAREVMELFTLGEGHYTEQDIKEAARAFTGWTVNRKGQFEFKENDHDFGEKEFMGQKGNFNGEEILNIIINNKQTAIYVVTKIYREFVNPVINNERVKLLAESFFNSGYDISLLMKKIFSSDWFYDDENIGCKISSPVELIVRYKKLIRMEFENDRALLNLQKALGQVLFFPPNVAGWKGGQNWIDSSTLLLRLNIANALLNEGRITIRPKPEFEDKPEETEQEDNEHMLSSDWSILFSHFKNSGDEKIFDELSEYLIQSSKDKIDKNKMLGFANDADEEKKMIKLASAIMATPEFQLI